VRVPAAVSMCDAHQPQNAAAPLSRPC
jgi:hypothetical protein